MGELPPFEVRRQRAAVLRREGATEHLARHTQLFRELGDAWRLLSSETTEQISINCLPQLGHTAPTTLSLPDRIDVNQAFFVS